MDTSDHRKESIAAARGATAAVVGTVLAATFFHVTACGSSNNSGTSPTASSVASSSPATSAGSSSPAQSTTAAQDQYDQQALQILDSIVRADFSGATAHFDSQMKQTLSPEALASDWASYQQQFGNYQSHGIRRMLCAGI